MKKHSATDEPSDGHHWAGKLADLARRAGSIVLRGGYRFGKAGLTSTIDLGTGVVRAVKGKRGRKVGEPGTRQDAAEATAVSALLTAEFLQQGSVPEEIESAYARAYPGLAADESFAEAVNRLDGDPAALEGLLSGIKGKLFEQRAAAELAADLPDGESVQLAASATQPGHDLEHIDADGELIGLLQAKAVATPEAVLDHLARHPDIPVITTGEVQQALAGHPALATWQPQILHVELSQEVSDAAVEVAGPSLLPFGATTVVAIRLATGDGSIDDRLCDAGEDIGRNFPAIMVASAVGTVTGTIWLAIPAAWGTRWLIGEGTVYRQQVWESLKQKLRGTPAPIHDIRLDPGGAR
ncbi:MAG: hypothetical protein HN891_01165 [Planctomycetes bacterium]|nr:hypothetical protein [Planctomycetota bacterium]MBT7129305.1 hypothetical protein [Planctomycetota bacterium]